MSYKAEHESFVSGGLGSTQLHIAVTVIASILPLHLRDVLYVLFPNSLPESAVYRHMLDFLLFVVPLQLFMSVLNQVSVVCLAIEILIITVLYNLYSSQNARNKSTGRTSGAGSSSTGNIPMGNRRPFINYFRAFVNLLTAFSILAVDFQIFPRYFAKAETYGTGLMDVGVGCFMISNAIVSPEARGKVSTDNVMTSVVKSVKSSIPLLVLGTFRVVAVKSTNYQEHVTEYGVHWNFFFTLAVVKALLRYCHGNNVGDLTPHWFLSELQVLMTVMFCTVPSRFWNMAGVGVIALYQHSLTYDGLKNYIIKGVDGRGGRHGFVDANREGLYSCCGYLSLYIMGVQLGKLLMKKREKVSDWIKLCIHLTMITAGTWTLLYFCEKYVEPVSRRFANLSYMLWMLAFNSLIILVILIFDVTVTCLNHSINSCGKSESPDNQQAAPAEVQYGTSLLMEAINYNGLAFFLLANLLTGLVNMAFRTIYQPAAVAMAILTGYMFVLSSIFSYLYHKKISLKVW